MAVGGASAGLPGDPLGRHQGVQVLPERYDEVSSLPYRICDEILPTSPDGFFKL